jgi:hypothetical protein
VSRIDLDQQGAGGAIGLLDEIETGDVGFLVAVADVCERSRAELTPPALRLHYRIPPPPAVLGFTQSLP